MPKTSVEISGGEALVHYDVTGSGPGLVLVHGTAATREQWLPLTEAARDRYTVVAPDYSGSGLTVDQGGELAVEDLAAEVLAAADDAGLGEFHTSRAIRSAPSSPSTWRARTRTACTPWCCKLAGPSRIPASMRNCATGSICWTPARSPACCR